MRARARGVGAAAFLLLCACAAPRPAAPPPLLAGSLRLGETAVMFQGELEGNLECRVLYRDGVALGPVRELLDAGGRAVVRRCLRRDMEASYLDEVGADFFGELGESYEEVLIGSEGEAGFRALDFPDRWSDISLSGSRAAYLASREERDTAQGGREAAVFGRVQDLAARKTLLDVRLGRCLMAPPASDDFLSLPPPRWAEDGRSVVFPGDASRCGFSERTVRLP